MKKDKINTGYTDHTGQELFVGDCVRIDGDYDWNGYITYQDGVFFVKYIDDGDEVPISNLGSCYIEKLKTFSEAVESGKVKPT